MQGIAKTEKAEKERKRKISLAMSKKRKSNEHRRKIKESIDTQKEERKTIMLKNWQDERFRKKMLDKRKRQWNEQSKNKVRQTLKEKWEDSTFREYMLACRKTPYTDKGYIEKLKESRAKQVFPVKDTKIEVKIQKYLEKLGIDFLTHQYIREIEHSYQCDISIPLLGLIIECDGDYWHNYPLGNSIDRIRTKELVEKGFKVLRLWENEIKIMDIDDFKRRLEC